AVEVVAVRLREPRPDEDAVDDLSHGAPPPQYYDDARRGVNPASRSDAGRAAPLALLVLLAAAIAQARAHGDDVHRADGRCEACHTAGSAALHAAPAAAPHLLAPDLAARR